MIRLMPPRVIVSHLRAALASLDFRKLVQSVAIVAEIPHPGHNPGRSPRSPYCSNCAANREFSPVGKETMIASVAANNNPEQFRLSITRPRLNAPSSVSLSLSLSLEEEKYPIPAGGGKFWGSFADVSVLNGGLTRANLETPVHC
jgi:hypothetical protein